MSIATQPAAATPNGAGTGLAPSNQKREVRVVEDNSAQSYLMDTARFEHMHRIAAAMANASLIPEHLRSKSGNHNETVGNCFLVVNQAVRWGFDPFALAPETYVVQNKLGFQGKLVAAVVNTRANLKGRLRYAFDGNGEDRTITVYGTFADESDERIVTLSVRQAKTANKIWVTDPDQKLVYSGVTKWARRHCPEVMLGVLTDDDLERMADAQRVIPEGPRPTSLEDLTERLTQRTAPVDAEASEPEVETDSQGEVIGSHIEDVDQTADAAQLALQGFTSVISGLKSYDEIKYELTQFLNASDVSDEIKEEAKGIAERYIARLQEKAAAKK